MMYDCGLGGEQPLLVILSHEFFPRFRVNEEKPREMKPTLLQPIDVALPCYRHCLGRWETCSEHNTLSDSEQGHELMSATSQMSGTSGHV